MKVLLHLCCAPCAVYPFSVLRQEGLDVRGYFFNPNIHPFMEFQKRLAAVREFSSLSGLEVEYETEYGLREFLRKIIFNEETRCELCYAMRLEVTVQKAKQAGVDAFTTTLLYSKHQKHGKIREIAEKLAAAHGIPFLYRDFRKGWQQGIDQSKEMGLYRQPYCGCIYSEHERYDRKAGKK